MTEMILPKRDRESVSASNEIDDITELMFGTVLETDPDKTFSAHSNRSQSNKRRPNNLKPA
jgi:hypothetical protein